jgi:molecular chaperone IbpA
MLLKEDVAMRMVDFAPLSRSWIGFDRLLDMLQNTAHFEQSEGGYPPYNVEKTGEDSCRITLAVAGFTPEELLVTTLPGQLTVAGNKAQNGSGEYLYQGIAGRAFQRQFNLADYVRVSGANLENGLLVIDLVREVPEEMKPRRIAIAGGQQAPQIESRAAA